MTDPITVIFLKSQVGIVIRKSSNKDKRTFKITFPKSKSRLTVISFWMKDPVFHVENSLSRMGRTDFDKRCFRLQKNDHKTVIFKLTKSLLIKSRKEDLESTVSTR